MANTGMHCNDDKIKGKKKNLGHCIEVRTYAVVLKVWD